MIIITIDKTVNVIKKYGEVFNLDNSSFLLDVYQLKDKLTYDGSGSLSGTYKVTYTSGDFVIGTISAYQGSCSVGNVATVLNPDVINTSVSFLVTGKDLQGVPFNRTYNVTYVTLSDGESSTFTTTSKGSLSTFPTNPEEGWVFYHTTVNSSFIYISGDWLPLASSGSNGTNGSGFSIKGTYADLASVPNPTVGDVVKVGTDTYMYSITGWLKIASEGAQGAQGPSGVDGASLFTVYNSASIDSPPPTPTGNGIGDGWSYASNLGSNWMSQKTSSSLNTGIWNDPILIAGRDGESIAGTDGKRGNLWLSESVDGPTMLLLSDEDPLVSDPAWVTTAGAVVVGQNLTPQNGDIVTLTYQNLALDAPVDSGWSEARRYEEDTNTWVDAGMFVSGDLLVEGTTWANGAIRSSNFQWNLELEPEGFLLSGNGIEDPNDPTKMYNIAAGSIYGSHIEGSSMKASYIEGSIIHATNTGTAGNVMLTSNGLYGYDNNSRSSFELNTSGLFSVGDTGRTVINRLPAKWSIFDEYLSVANEDMWANNPAVDAYTTTPVVSSDGSLKSVLRVTNYDPVGVTDAYVYLGKDNTYYNIPVTENTNYVISFYVLRESGPINNGQVYIRRNGDSSTNGQTFTMPSNGVWYRRHYAFNSLSANKILIRFDVDRNPSILIDRVMLEVMLEQTNSTTPSNFEHPNSGYLKWDNDKLTLLGGIQTHTEGERLTIGNDTNSLIYHNSRGSEAVSIGNSKLIDNPALGGLSRSAYIYSKNTRNDEYSLYCESSRIAGYFYSSLQNNSTNGGGINVYALSRINHNNPGAISIGINSHMLVDSSLNNLKHGVNSVVESINGANLYNTRAVVGEVRSGGAGGVYMGVFGLIGPTTAAGEDAFSRIGVNGQANCQGSSVGVLGWGNTYDFYAGGAGANYAPFTGSHEAVVPKGSNYLIGDIIVDLDIISTRGISNTVFTARLSDSSLDRAIGVVASEEMHYNPNALGDGFKAAEKGEEEEPAIDLLPEGTNCIAFNALGEGQVNVCGEGGNLSNGDLVMCSNMPGKGMRQNKTDGTPDDIIRNITVAKVRGNWTFDNPQEVKQVACIYLCG